MKLYYRLVGDRKYFSTNEEDVIDYAKTKKGITEHQANELREFGVTIDGSVEIKQFASR